MTPTLSKETLSKVKLIEIRTNRLVNDLFGGEYESVFKGQGIEFADVREYVPGDDIRTIDWNVTARSQRPFVKKYVEERELTVLFVVDASFSNFFGSGKKMKYEVAAEITALLAFSAVINNDKVGLAFFTDRIEKYIPVKKGKSHALRVVREILTYKPERTKTDMGMVLQYLSNVLNRRAVIFLISDFLDSGYEKPLKILGKEHDIIGIHLFDPREREIPKMGYVVLEDAETGDEVMAHTNSSKFQEIFKKITSQNLEQIDKLFKKVGLDKIEINITKSYVEPLIKFFRAREKRFR
ncbi:MAG: DUF58 domain-containing protein [Candidatus Omnitrophica bacterium]|nr:DUF58 domain-containing protein [Candidatus Omnitrophota bacterium]